MIDIYNVKVHFYSLYNAGVKHSLKDHIFTSNYRSFHFVYCDLAVHNI